MSYKLETNKIDGKAFPLDSLRLSVGGDTFVSIFSGSIPLAIYAGNYYDFTDGTGTPFANIGAFVTYWNANFNADNKVQVVKSDGSPVNPNSTYLRSSVEITRPNTTPTYNAGDSINETVAVIKELINVTTSAGGGGVIMDCMIECDDVTNFAGKTVTLWLYKTAPTAVADDAAFTNLYANKDKRVMSIPVTFPTPVTGSDCCIGEASVIKEFVCDPASTSLYCALQYTTGGVAAASKHFNIVLRTVVS